MHAWICDDPIGPQALNWQGVAQVRAWDRWLQRSEVLLDPRLTEMNKDAPTCGIVCERLQRPSSSP